MEQRRHGFTSMLLPWEFCARLSSTFGPNGPATSHIVGLCILAIQDDVAVRRMEEIDVDVLYEAWKRIEITKRIGAATRVRACSHAVLYDADAVGETYTQSSGKEISMNEMVIIAFKIALGSRSKKKKIWRAACVFCGFSSLGHFARECRTKGNQDSRRRDAWNSGNKDGRRSGKQEDSKALVTIDGEGVDWTSHSEEEEDYALMACNSSGSDTEVTSCSNECKESYAKLKKLYDAQREQLSDASIEIKAYTQGLKKVEAQLVAHQQGQLWYEEKIRFMKIDLDDKTDVLTYHKKLLAEAQKEKEDLKAKVEKWHKSSKNLGKLLNTQMSANDKFRLGYGDHRYDGILSYENEVLQSVFMTKESELEKQPLYDRFVTTGGMHVVPPPMTGKYMPTGPDIECMRTRNSYFPNNSNVTIPRRRNKGRAPNIVEPELRTIVAPMAERTMEELLRAPTEGYGEAIVLPEINADHFEIKTNLLQLVQANPFYGRESENPHAHINSFKRITSTLRFRNVPNDVIKLMMFPYSLEGATKTCEAWERFKELLRACPRHGFTELTQVYTFFNGLNENEQDSLNAAAHGNLLIKTTREALNIIENKSKVCYSRNRSNASRMNATSSKTDERIDKLADQLSTLVKIVSKKVVTPAPVKAVWKNLRYLCGACPHSWYNLSVYNNNQA
ncbi:hypothetical protein Tco_0363139 [Tanacetum coccineum]